MRHGFLTQGCIDPYIPRTVSHWDCHLVPLTALLAPALGYPCSSCYTKGAGPTYLSSWLSLILHDRPFRFFVSRFTRAAASRGLSKACTRRRGAWNPLTGQTTYAPHIPPRAYVWFHDTVPSASLGHHVPV
jgi:hypothetical protein